MENLEEIEKNEKNHLLVTIIDKPIIKRIANAFRHNRVKANYLIDYMVEIDPKLAKSELSNQWIMQNNRIDRDELLCLKQISRLAFSFKNNYFHYLGNNSN
ncbi:hypothetical protein ACIJDF_002606 [Enterococcus hirae]